MRHGKTKDSRSNGRVLVLRFGLHRLDCPKPPAFLPNVPDRAPYVWGALSETRGNAKTMYCNLDSAIARARQKAKARQAWYYVFFECGGYDIGDDCDAETFFLGSNPILAIGPDGEVQP